MPNCDEMLDLISAKLDNELTAEEAAVLEAHLSDCPACRAVLSDFEAMHGALSDLATHPAPPPAQLREDILASIRDEQVIPITPARRRWHSWAAMAAACAIIVVGAYGTTHWMARGGSAGQALSGSSAAVTTTAGDQGAAPSVAAAPAPSSDDIPAGANGTSLPEEGSVVTIEPEMPTTEEANPEPVYGGQDNTGSTAPATPQASLFLQPKNGSAFSPLTRAAPTPALGNGVDPQSIAPVETETPVEGGVNPALYSVDTVESGGTYCGILTLPWSLVAELGDAPYTEENQERHYLVPAAEFSSLSQSLEGQEGVSSTLEGDGISADAGQGLVIVTGVPAVDIGNAP